MGKDNRKREVENQANTLPLKIMPGPPGPGSLLSPRRFSRGSRRFAANQPLGRFDALYLSFVSLTCLGCNDITPISKVARMLLMVESTTGVLYLAVLIARLVTLYSRSVESGTEQQPKA